MKIDCNFYPDWKRRAVTFSYDDGGISDRRLAEILDKYGAKCTFNLCSGQLNGSNRLTKADVLELSERHEIACHSQNHPFLERLPLFELERELSEDKRTLEDITGKPVIGMAYPYGTYDEQVIATAKGLGIQYARTTNDARRFSLPSEFMEWHPTCHHREGEAMTERFLSYGDYYLLYIWGHGHEYERDGNWYVLENILKRLSEQDIYYATNGELYEYFAAIKSLRLVEGGVDNPTNTDVYATINGEKRIFAHGVTKL